MNKFLKSIGYILYIGFFTGFAVFLLLINNSKKNTEEIVSWEVTNSWIISTWSWEPSSILENEKEHKIEVLTWWIIIDTLDIWKYPKIQINSKITKWTIFYEIEPIDSIKDWWYFLSDSYYFAFRFFVWDFENWGYYNTFRKSNNGVWNDLSLWLNGAISGKILKDWHKWIIPLQEKVIIAKDKESYGYWYINTLNLINSNIWKEVSIWGFLSSIKEYPEWWWKITKIKSIIIVYEWDKWAITINK